MIKEVIWWFKEHKKVSVIILLVVTAVMGYGSSLPGDSPGLPSFNWFPLAYHFTIFFLFAFFFLMIIADKEIKTREILTAIIFTFIVAILDELHQSFVPFRDPSIEDWLIDSGGALFSIAVCGINKKLNF